MPRIHCPLPLATGLALDLPAGAARHVQVLRYQPGDALTLFAGEPGGGEFEATVTRMGRSDVQVMVGAHRAVEREAQRAIHLLAGIIANERMDWLVEKATELGAASFTPLLAARSVLKLKGDRSERKLAHWQAVAIAACEQSGRNGVPPVHEAVSLTHWVKANPVEQAAAASPLRLLLSLQPDARPLREAATGEAPIWLLSGPEGGLTPEEEVVAREAGFVPVTLGPRVLRAETAPLAVLAALLQD